MLVNPAVIICSWGVLFCGVANHALIGRCFSMSLGYVRVR